MTPPARREEISSGSGRPGGARQEAAVAVVDATRDPGWAGFVEEADAHLFQSPAWSRVLAASYDFEPLAVVLADDSGVRAGMPFVVLDDIRGRRVICLPFSDFCGPLAGSAREWTALADALARYEAPVTIRSLRSDLPLRDPRFETVGRAHWHGVDLTGGEEEVFAALASAARRAVRRAEKLSVKVRPAAEKGELRRFFELHLRVRKSKYRLLAQPYRFFENIWDEFVAAERGTLLMAELDGELIAGSLFLDWGDATYYKFNASDLDYSSVRANEAVMWQGMSRGIAAGLARLDLGLSDWGQEGLTRYKRKFATEEGTITSVRWDPGEMPGRVSAASPLLTEVTRLLTDPGVPDEVTEQAGNVLYRYFA